MMILGATSPILIAKITVTAVTPSAIVAWIRGKVASERPASRTKPLAILKKNTPGIIDTTDANPIAAKGMWYRRAIGVRINPTKAQATIAPLATPALAQVRVHHLTAWASIPTATG